MGLDSRTWDAVRDEVRRKLSVEALARSLGIPLEKAGAGFKMPHHGEKTPSAQVHADHWKCFGCGARGDIFDLWIEARGGSQGDALRALAETVGVRLPELTPEAAKKMEQVARVRDLVKLVADAAHAELSDEQSEAARTALRWLIGRGIRRDTALEAGLGVLGGYDWCVKIITAKGKGGLKGGLRSGLIRQSEPTDGSEPRVYDALHHTVVFPVARGGAGRALTLIGRTHSGLLEGDRRKAKTLKLTTDETKAPDAPEVPLLWWPGPVTGDVVVLVEGEIDALTVAQAGFGVAGLLSAGAAKDERTAEELLHGRPSRSVYMMPDRDAAGRKAAADLAAQLGHRLRIVEPWAELEGCKDPNDALMHHVREAGGDVGTATGQLRAEITRAIEVAPLWVRWESEQLVRECAGDPSRLAAAVRRVVLPALVAVSDGLTRAALVDELAEVTGLAKRALGTAVKVLEAEVAKAKKTETDAKVDPKDSDPLKRPFALGDHTELSVRLLEIVEADSPVPSVYDRGDLYLYDAEAGIWRPLAAPTVMSVVDRFSGMPVVKRRDEESGDVEYEPLRITDTATRGAWSAAVRARHNPGYFDEGPPGIAFPNGYLRVSREGDVSFGAHDPEHRATVLAACPWVPGTRAPQWFAFLARVWDGCPDVAERVRSVHEFAGLALFGESTAYQKCLVLPGPKAGNGKSSFQDVLSAMFPERARTSIAPQDWGKDAYLAALAPSRWNVVGELPRGSIVQADRFNAVVDGSPVTCNPKYKHAFTYRPRAAHIFACNTLPNSDNENEGFWRRLIVIDFPNTFRKGDSGFVWEISKKIIADELPAVYEACVMAAADVMARRGTVDSGITEPSSAADNLEKWRTDGDTIRQWLEERCEIGDGPAMFTAAKVAWLDYLEWAREANIRHQYSKITFGRRMSQLELGARTMNDRGYCLRLRPKEVTGMWAPGGYAGSA